MDQTHNFPPASAASLEEAAALPETPENSEAQRWTGAKQAQFLRTLAATHCVKAAARAVGLSRQSAYQLRNRLKGEPFDIAWRCAFRRQLSTLAEIALERAICGTEVPHYYKGELVGTHRVFDARLTLALVKMQGKMNPDAPVIHAEQARYQKDDFELLLDRVEEGDEYWEREDWEDEDDDESDFAMPAEGPHMPFGGGRK